MTPEQNSKTSCAEGRTLGGKLALVLVEQMTALFFKVFPSLFPSSLCRATTSKKQAKGEKRGERDLENHLTLASI